MYRHIARISLVVFICLLGVSLLLSSLDPAQSWGQYTLWVGGAALFFGSSLVVIPRKYILFFLFAIAVGASMLWGGYIFWDFKPGFVTTQANQFIIPGYGGHNHLGDLAGLTTLSLLLSRVSPFSIGAIIALIGIMVLSFSKSAFLALVVGFGVYAVYAKKKKVVFIAGLLALVSICILLLYSSEFSRVPVVSNVQRAFFTRTHLDPKQLLSVRNIYFSETVTSWTTSSLLERMFGYGLGNFAYASQRVSTDINLAPPQVHNVILSLFIETGALPTLWFCLWALIIIVIGMRGRDNVTYLFLYLLANFQTDYTYAIPFFLLVFFFLGGQIIADAPKSEKGQSMGMALCCLLLVVGAGWHAQSLIQQKQWLQSSYMAAVKQQDKTVITHRGAQLESLTPYSTPLLKQLSSVDEAFGSTNEAVRLLDKLAVYAPHEYVLAFPHILTLAEKIQKGAGALYIKAKLPVLRSLPLTSEEKRGMNTQCRNYIQKNCY